jgi:hypothetical protein
MRAISLCFAPSSPSRLRRPPRSTDAAFGWRPCISRATCAGATVIFSSCRSWSPLDTGRSSGSAGARSWSLTYCTFVLADISERIPNAVLHSTSDRRKAQAATALFICLQVSCFSTQRPSGSATLRVWGPARYRGDEDGRRVGTSNRRCAGLRRALRRRGMAWVRSRQKEIEPRPLKVTCVKG